MTTRTKILAALLSAALALGAIAFVQERKQHSIAESVRTSLAVGDSKEKVEQVMREHGLRPEVSKDGRTYRAHVWFHFRPDVSVIVALDEESKVGMVFVEDRIE